MKSATDTIRIGTQAKPLSWHEWNERRCGRKGRKSVRACGEDWPTEALFHTAFEIVKHKGQTMTALEADLRGPLDWLLDVTSFGESYPGKGDGKPILVDKATWQAALALKPDAIREANKMQPGCVYAHPAIVSWIIEQTRLAACALTEAERTAAADRLTKALIPQHRQKKSRPLSLWPDRRAYRKCYRDVVSIRYASKLIDRTHRISTSRIALPYPETEAWSDEWKRAVLFSRGAPSLQLAAGKIMADILTADDWPLFAPDSFRKQDPEWKEVRPALERKGKRRALLRLSICGFERSTKRKSRARRDAPEEYRVL